VLNASKPGEVRSPVVEGDALENQSPEENSREARENAEGGLGDLFDEHIAKEFVDHDADATIATMVPEPYVYNVPTMVGGFGGEGVRFLQRAFCKSKYPKLR
jgi:hypothetical protein